MNTFAYVGGNPINRADPSGLLFGGLINAGECYGDSAAQYWADKAANSTNIESWGYAFLGGLASLWTPNTSDSTAITLLAAGTMPGVARWAEWGRNPVMYEIGAKTVSTSVWNELRLAGMSVSERGATIWAEYGWSSLGISEGPWLSTLAQGPTPGGWLAMVGLLDYAKNKFGNRGLECGCEK